MDDKLALEPGGIVDNAGAYNGGLGLQLRFDPTAVPVVSKDVEREGGGVGEEEDTIVNVSCGSPGVGGW